MAHVIALDYESIVVTDVAGSKRGRPSCTPAVAPGRRAGALRLSVLPA
jgi:hypothetical protein